MAFCKGKCVQWAPNAKWGKLTALEDPNTEIFALIQNVVDGQPLTVGDIVEYELTTDGMGNKEAKSIRKLQSAPDASHSKPRRRKASESDDEKQEIAPQNEQYTSYQPPLQHHSPPQQQSMRSPPACKQPYAQPQHQQPEYPQLGSPQHQQHHPIYPQQPMEPPKSQPQKPPYNSPQPQQRQAPLQHNDTGTTPEGCPTPGAPSAVWACGRCTFENHANTHFCGMCGGPKPQPQHMKHEYPPHQPQQHAPHNYPPQHAAYPMHEPLRAQMSEDIDEDEEIRKSWEVNDLVEVFSTTLQKWCEAKIIGIDPRNIWLTVRYIQVAKKREIKRNDPNIRPIPRGGSKECTPDAPPQPEEPQIDFDRELNKKIETARLQNIKLKNEIEKQRLRQKQELHDKKMRFENELQEDRQREKELDARIKNIEMRSNDHHNNDNNDAYGVHSDWKGDDYPQQQPQPPQQPPFQHNDDYANDRRQPQYHDEYEFEHQAHDPPMHFNTGNAMRGDMSSGTIYLQTGFFTQSQMQKVQQRYGQNTHKGPKFLFGDNYADRFRAQGVKRNAFGGQSQVMGHYDRSFGFGIPTTFSQSAQFGFRFNSHSFRKLINELFDELVQHIQNGGDVVIPYPTEQIMQQAPHKYFKDGERFVFHNLGTGQGSLKIDELTVIQHAIDKLKKRASQTIECNEAYSR